MKSITTLENIPDSLDIQEMMDVKGGAEINANICLLAAAVKCTVAGAGTCTTKGSWNDCNTTESEPESRSNYRTRTLKV